MRRKIVLKLLFVLTLILLLCGCDGSDVAENTHGGHDTEEDEDTECYEVDYCGQKDLFKKAEDSYEAGEKVKIYFDVIATDTDYTFYLDDEILDVDFSAEKGYIIKFTMPDHDVTLRVESVNSMEAVTDSLLDTLLWWTDCSEDEVAAYVRDDFDGDGTEEAFALVGKETDDLGEYIFGTIWFVTDEGCENLYSSVGGMGLRKEPGFLTLGDTKYIFFNDCFVSESYSIVFYVSDGKALDADFSYAGAIGYSENEPDRFTITDSSYDMYLEAESGFTIGHTYKKYYFFYDPEDGGIYEYAGTNIDAATVEFWCGRDLVNELIPEEDTVTGIFMRGNGLIVINYEHAEDDGKMHYFHYIYSTLKESFIDDMGRETDEEPQLGIYLNSICPQMASYPEVPGPGDSVWYGE